MLDAALLDLVGLESATSRQWAKETSQVNRGRKGDCGMGLKSARLIALFVVLSCPAAADEPHRSRNAELFEQSVLPLLKKHCYECHSHEFQSAEGGLVLDSRVGWESGGDSGPALIPGESDSSLLFRAVSYVDDELRMPPDGRLSGEEIALLGRWIQDGAFDPRRSMAEEKREQANDSEDLWSLKPLHVDRDQPNSVDRFIDQRLQSAGLQPNGPADRVALIRRASFDLIGLPPTIDEIRQFVSDDRPDAWNRLIDRLLSSPYYGERWGRHWLDLARYGDSNGGDINYAHANAWRYRDYVIKSFNEDKPYDTFLREQLAGDLIASGASDERRAELLTATGFLMLGPKMLSEVDGEKLLIDIVDEQLDTAGKTFLGMTFGCARCHDHKFDPISSRDYYALAGIFRSTKVMRVLRPEKVVGEWVEVDVTPVAQRKRIDELKAEKSELESELAVFGQPQSKATDPNAAARSVVVGNLPMLRSTTWAARVRIDSNQNLGAVISADYPGASQGHSLGFDRVNNGRLPRVVWNHNQSATIITASQPVALGQWHHLAVTYDAETKRLDLYVNGEPAASAEGVASSPFTTIGVGRREAPKQFQLLGDVDDIAVYDTALSQENIVVLDAGQELAQRPVLHWDFETILDNQVIDRSGGYNGRFIGVSAKTNIVEDGFRGNGLSFRFGNVLSELEKSRLLELRARMKAIDQELPESISVMAVQADNPVELPVHIRGSHTNLSKEPLARTTPRIFESRLPAVKIGRQDNGRLKLAQWMVHQDHPLTARVMVNRIWQQHFGIGIVRTPSNFGVRGARPTHPQLLDWLAQEFMEHQWSIKHIHRLIMTSDAYRRSSDDHALAAEKDADNRLLSRFPIRRLEAEAIRDSMLAVSGELCLGSPGNLLKSPNMKRVSMTPTDPTYQALSRGVYLPAIRVRGYEMFSVFDVAGNGQHLAVRPNTMVAQQALFFMNNAFVIDRAKAVAERVISRGQSDFKNIEWLYQLLFSRQPGPNESKLLIDHLQAIRDQLAASAASLRSDHNDEQGLVLPTDGSVQDQLDAVAWRTLVHSLFCANEFIHVP